MNRNVNIYSLEENITKPRIGARRKRLSPILGWNIPVPTLNPPDGRDARWRKCVKKPY